MARTAFDLCPIAVSISSRQLIGGRAASPGAGIGIRYIKANLNASTRTCRFSLIGVPISFHLVRGRCDGHLAVLPTLPQPLYIHSFLDRHHGISASARAQTGHDVEKHAGHLTGDRATRDAPVAGWEIIG